MNFSINKNINYIILFYIHFLFKNYYFFTLNNAHNPLPVFLPVLNIQTHLAVVTTKLISLKFTTDITRHFFVNDLKFDFHVYYFHKNFLSVVSTVGNAIYTDNFDFFYFGFIVNSFFIDDKHIFLNYIEDFKSASKTHFDLITIFSDHSYSSLLPAADKDISLQLRLFSLNRKKSYLNQAIRKIANSVSAPFLKSFKHRVYTTFGSILSRRLRIFFNHFIVNYISKNNTNEQISSFMQYLLKAHSKTFRHLNIFESISLKYKSMVVKNFSLYFNDYFDKNIFFSSLKNYFLNVLNFTSFIFVKDFYFSFHLFLIKFNIFRSHYLITHKEVDTDKITYPWILHFRIKPTRTFYFTLTNSAGEVKFHFSNNYFFNTVKKAKYKIEISKSLKKTLLLFLRKNHIFFIHSFYTSQGSRKFIFPIMNFFKKNSILVKNIVFYRKVAHSNHLKKKLRKLKRI